MNEPQPAHRDQSTSIGSFFTHISTLVTIGAVIGLIVLLIFPLVNYLRDASARTRTQENLKDMALAILNYQEANNGHFALACDFGPRSATNSGFLSLHFLIGPYMENGTMMGLVWTPPTLNNYSKPIGQNPPGMAGVILRPYLHPRDPSFPDGYQAGGVIIDGITPDGVGGAYATTNYAVNGMLFTQMPNDKAPGIKDMTDGTSQTIMIAERYQLCGSVPTLWGMGAYSATTPTFALAAPTGPHPHTNNPGWELKQFVPLASVTANANLPVPFQVTPWLNECDPSKLQSLFRSGMIVALADGSTRTIAPNITPATFWAAVTPFGNDKLGEDW